MEFGWDLLVWSSYSFCLIWLVFKGRNPLYVIHLCNIQGREVCLFDFHQRNINICFHPDICCLISFKFDTVMETTELDSLMPLWMTFVFIQDHSFMSFFFFFSNVCTHFLVLSQYGWNLVCFDSLLICWISSKSVVQDWNWRERTLLTWFYAMCL